MAFVRDDSSYTRGAGAVAATDRHRTGRRSRHQSFLAKIGAARDHARVAATRGSLGRMSMEPENPDGGGGSNPPPPPRRLILRAKVAAPGMKLPVPLPLPKAPPKIFIKPSTGTFSRRPTPVKPGMFPPIIKRSPITPQLPGAVIPSTSTVISSPLSPVTGGGGGGGGGGSVYPSDPMAPIGPDDSSEEDETDTAPSSPAAAPSKSKGLLFLALGIGAFWLFGGKD